MVCFMYDVGNLLFGYFGEYVINDWFECNFDVLFECCILLGQGDGLLQQCMFIDFKYFEGNVQVICLVVKLLCLNFIYMQIVGLFKYVCLVYELKLDKVVNYYLNKKLGFYFFEEVFVDELC